jgi:hypothetical protein
VKNRDFSTRSSLVDLVIGRLFNSVTYETFDGMDIVADLLGDWMDHLDQDNYKVATARHFQRAVQSWTNMRAKQANPKREIPISISAYGEAPRVVRAFLDNRCKLNSFVVLLHGVPGTGKSYFPTLFGSYCTERLSSIEKCVVADEDGEKGIWEIDSSLTVINEVDRLTPEGITVLQAQLDEIRAGQGKKLVILTTNHFDKLKDLPLVRPSRVDYIQEVGMIVEDDAKQICDSYSVPWNKDKFVGEMSVAAVTQFARQELLEKIIRGEFDTAGSDSSVKDVAAKAENEKLMKSIFKSRGKG